MSDKTKTTGEIAGRRVFLALYVAFISAFGIWSLVSVLAVHLGLHKDELHFSGPLISAQADNPAELLRCHKDLDQLLGELHQETFSIQAKALKFNFDPAAEWRNWSPGWIRRWKIVGRRCRLSDLRGRGVHHAIDALADIHGALEELQLSYTGVMDRFVENYSERLRTLKHKLGVIPAMILRPPKRAGQHSRATQPPIAELGV